MSFEQLAELREQLLLQELEKELEQEQKELLNSITKYGSPRLLWKAIMSGNPIEIHCEMGSRDASERLVPCYTTLRVARSPKGMSDSRFLVTRETEGYPYNGQSTWGFDCKIEAGEFVFQKAVQAGVIARTNA